MNRIYSTLLWANFTNPRNKRTFCFKRLLLVFFRKWVTFLNNILHRIYHLLWNYNRVRLLILHAYYFLLGIWRQKVFRNENGVYFLLRSHRLGDFVLGRSFFNPRSPILSFNYRGCQFRFHVFFQFGCHLY